MDGGENIKYGLDFIETVKPLTRVISELLPSVSTVTIYAAPSACSPRPVLADSLAPINIFYALFKLFT